MSVPFAELIIVAWLGVRATITNFHATNYIILEGDSDTVVYMDQFFFLLS